LYIKTSIPTSLVQLLISSRAIKMHFSKLAIVASTVALAAAAPPKKAKRAGNFEFFGVNESGAEFGNLNLPGVLGTDYTWPVTYVI
jgi:hypothetical protein